MLQTIDFPYIGSRNAAAIEDNGLRYGQKIDFSFTDEGQGNVFHHLLCQGRDSKHANAAQLDLVVVNGTDVAQSHRHVNKPHMI